MNRKALAEKIIILGIDGMDPRLTKKYLDAGIMPNLKKYLEHGSAREDLVLLGAHPTITPPMWTTLSTGAYPNTHGITCFWNQHPSKIDTFRYANDSHNCKAEQLWNVFAEAGKKTLVWHWPGCSWPPTSDSENLAVVEGTQPSSINYGIGSTERAKLYYFDEAYQTEQVFDDNGVKISGVGCVVDDMDVKEEGFDVQASLSVPDPQPISMDATEGECHAYGKPVFHTESPLKAAKNWAVQGEGDKEFEVTFSDGMIRRVGLLRKNADGIYDTIEIYKSKKDNSPLLTLKNNEYVVSVLDERVKHDEKVMTTASWYAIDVDPKGSKFKLWIGNSTKLNCDDLFSPKSLYQEVISACGEIPSIENGSNYGPDAHLVKDIMCVTWQYYDAWQAKAINTLIEQDGYEVVFSHLHNVDSFGHIVWEERNAFGNEEHEIAYEEVFKQVYMDTDAYLGEFLHLLDKGWCVVITSDHGLLTKEEPGICPSIGDAFVINTGIMRELGYTVMVRDDKGKETRQIDYSKTKAVASRGNHIYLNMKGRYEYGIVDESEKYELETQIINDLYAYRNKDGKRVIGLAMRNKDAALLGMSGPDCGDIIYFVEEGFNRVHGDALSTFIGNSDTSVSPLFIIAGEGVKHNHYTNRVIRQVDVAPTIAVIGGVRMPHECEGAPVYQILAEEF